LALNTVLATVGETRCPAPCTGAGLTGGEIAIIRRLRRFVMTGTPNQRVRLAVLREYTAQSGRQYFAGYLARISHRLIGWEAVRLSGSELGLSGAW
jgi:hypothetical protein